MDLFITALSFFLIIFIPQIYSLECYVCTNQENNLDKCVRTIKTCDASEDRCLAQVRWGSTPYWAPTGEKQFYVSKSCATKQKCGEALRNVTTRCDRIWYNDWECAECCYGDRCNYFVTLAGTNLHAAISTLFLTLMSLLTLRIVYW